MTPINLKDLRLLLVDDEEPFRQGLARAFKKRGIVCQQAGSGEECISILNREKIDVLILDIKMPGMDGFEVLDYVKKKSLKTEVLLLTGYATTEDGVNGIKQGAFDYLGKPVQMEHLLVKIVQAYQKILREEEIYREAEASYQALLQSVTDYVVGVNRNYQIIMANDLFKKRFGSFSDAPCFSIWKKREKKCSNCLVEKSFRDGKSHTKEEDVVMDDGSIARMLVRSTPVTNQKGKIIYVLETATDITKKKLLQADLSGVTGRMEGFLAQRLRELQESEKKYRTIFERSSDAIMLVDSNGKILEINQAGVEMFGYDNKTELLALKSASELLEDKKSFYDLQKSITTDGYVKEFETRLMGNNGKAFEALITSNVTLNEGGQLTGYVIIIKDITTRKMAQKQIQIRNIRLAILKAISMAVSTSLDLHEILYSSIDKMLEIPEIMEPDSVRIYLLAEDEKQLNLAAHKGFSKDFFSQDFMRSRRIGDGHVGQTVLTGRTIIVDDFLHSNDPYVETLKKEGLKSTVYIPLVSKSKSLGVMSVSTHSEYKFSSYHVEFLTVVGNQLGVAVDNANLFEKSKRAYEQLKAIQEQVIQTEKLASLGKLSATIAHEINNPLAAVLTYIKLMIKLVERGLFFSQERSEDVKRYLGTMESEVTRCGEIVKNLLAFARHSKVDIKSHSITEIIDRTLLLITHDLEIKNTHVKKEMAPNLPEILCDFKQIQQALLNLIVNASEAMEKGGTITVSAGYPGNNGFVEILISDTGCGIPDEEIKHIFEPFFTTKEEGKGVGLGLSVVFGIITRHNGSIDVESEIGKGTSFRIRLPVA
ncbi:PAS domain S-box protein (modular protein) [uncultured Desulfobacterium sp.]|uniref:histidine kinase n=1 Tax=uncultured Desulfobacterium sp. TaxID=201089 RepID=A0A445N1Z9_9BACT|nr:PAS domain S-box protein (modular protein) [uncultured Desulfobacterium sp.]